MMGSGKACNDSVGVANAVRPFARARGPSFMTPYKKGTHTKEVYLQQAEMWRGLRTLHTNMVFTKGAIKRALKEVLNDLGKGWEKKLSPEQEVDWVETVTTRIKQHSRWLAQTTRKHPRMMWIVQLWGEMGTPGVLASGARRPQPAKAARRRRKTTTMMT